MRFYVLQGGKRLGPFTREELGQLVRDGAVDAHTRLETEEGTQTVLAEILPVGTNTAGLSGPASGFFPTEPETTREEVKEKKRLSFFRWAETLLFAVGGLYFLIRRPETFLDWVDLPFHEAGHVLFGIFGEFIGFLGGTIMQLLIPAVVTFSFARAGKVIGVRFALFWLGQSFLNVARYAADARAVDLPLIGGMHDWNYLLGRLDLLQYDATVGAFFTTLGGLSFLAATVWPFLTRPRQ
ncbi:MAG: GYF domain-containing protein [Firmicutes bacterium]|nr:GYF domain-containing protein [Bacillota bacterium]